MKVYILSWGQYADRETVGVFSSKEAAEEYCAAHYREGAPWHRDDHDIEECELDDPSTLRYV